MSRSRSSGRFTHRGVYTTGSCSGERGKVLTVETYCYTLPSAGAAVGSAALGALAPTEGGEGRGHIVAAARLQPVKVTVTLYISGR